jgi:AAA ATPase domain/Bacterial regulatory protein, Fis family
MVGLPRLIAATQAELSVRVTEGRFRGDLYHRVAVVLLDIPPLRDRGEDVLILAEAILRQYAEAYRLSPKHPSATARGWLQSHQWPGNVRELSHLLERVMLLSAETIISPDTLERLCLRPPPSSASRAPAKSPRADKDDAAQITQALRRTGGNVERAARLLGLSRKAVRYRMRKYGIARLPKDEKPQRPSHASRTGRPVVPSQFMEEEAHPGEAVTSAPSWEQKLVAVLALELSWPSTVDGEAPRHEPWTARRRWELTMVEKVRGFGGVVLQRSPSLFLVAFGLPHTLEQLPQRAVQAALALRQLVAGLPVGEVCPELRQAVHWGQLLVDVEARDPTPEVLGIGDTLTRPVRLLGHTAPGEILLSPEVAPVVESWCELQACEGPFRAEPSDRIGAYTVVGLRSRQSQLAMYGHRPLSRFVGRARELATLTDLLVPVTDGRGQVVGVVGEPGVGKSRVCYEFISAHHTEGWLILETSADSYGQATPYLPIIDLLKAYFHLNAGDDQHTVRAKVTDRLLALKATLQPVLPALLVLLGVPVEDPQWQALDPPQRRRCIMDGIKYLLLREREVRPLLLVVENLHWIDGETQGFLNSFVESLPAAHVLLLVSYRPEYQHGWTSKTYYTQLRLDPLAPEHAQTLAHAVLGTDTGIIPLTRRLLERTEGNPFFLEESVRGRVETHVLAGVPGAYRLMQPVQHIQVPSTVHMGLAARLDHLPSDAKHLLQAAAVIGKDVPFSLLQGIMAQPAEVLRQG